MSSQTSSKPSSVEQFLRRKKKKKRERLFHAAFITTWDFLRSTISMMFCMTESLLQDTEFRFRPVDCLLYSYR